MAENLDAREVAFVGEDTIGDTLYQSTYSGVTWKVIFTNIGTGGVGGDFPINSMTFPSAIDIFVGGNSGAYHSSNGGGSWSYIDGSSGLGAANISLLATDGNGNIFAEVSSGSNLLFRSTDDGTTWNLVGSGLFTNGEQHRVLLITGILFMPITAAYILLRTTAIRGIFVH